MKGNVRLRICKIIRQVCDVMGVQIMKDVLSSDHVHMFVEIPPSIPVGDFVQRVKSRSPDKIQQEFLSLIKSIGAGVFERGYILHDQ